MISEAAAMGHSMAIQFLASLNTANIANFLLVLEHSLITNEDTDNAITVTVL